MKKILLNILFLTTIATFSQSTKVVYKSGEKLKYRMHYGAINVGYATIDINATTNEGKDAFHVIGKGWTSGMANWFFKVEDDYQTWFYKDSQKPYHFRRRVNEGGHIISRDIYFDHDNKKALIKDHKKNIERTSSIGDIQDMISSFYYLRNQNLDALKVGEEIKMNMFFDAESFGFKMRYLGDDILKTKFGKIKCHKFRPLVQAGRIFKADESLTIWVTSDKNKIPIRIKAELAVGSLKADLDEFRGLANPFNIIF